ncbi:phosphoglycerate dehydrogenase [Kineococcus glutinatus]|uniref:Phosphoglycerate dehydrogenase n=1 Tax=Kineococcus glutinatus TaxID=1070872 RepID=A0ABP9HUZ9_9ACTN
MTPAPHAPTRTPLAAAGPSRPLTGRPRALLLEGVHPEAAALLHRAGFDVDDHRGALGEDALIAAIRGVQVLGIRSRTRVSRRVLHAAGDLQAVGAFCTGTDQIDLQAATERGVAVFNAPHANGRSVAELALAEVIALTRRLPERNAAAHAGVWDKSATGSHEVRGRCLGIVGYGAIGTQLSVLAEALGMDVVFHDLAERAPVGRARRCETLHELLVQADAVSLHVDGRPQNAGLIGEAQLAAMRPGSVLLNLSRGSVVDLAALRRHLTSGHLAGAAIDVFPDEPSAAGRPFTNPLRGLPNVLLTPHVGGSTQEAQREIAVSVANRLVSHARTTTTARAA